MNVCLLPPPETDTQPAVEARAAALLAATQAANARRLAEAEARAAAILAQAEQANTEFLRLAEEQAAVLLASLPSIDPRPEPAPQPLAAPEWQPLASIDGGVDLIAGPFARFSHLATFSQAVRGLPGVVSLDTREFLKGTVHLRLRYEDPIPLAMRLSELAEFRPVVVAAMPGRVELRVNLVDDEALVVAHAA